MSNDNQKEEEWDCPKPMVREIQMTTKRPFIGSSYRSLKKTYQRQVNNIHVTELVTKCRCTYDITFSERDARGIRQPHNDHLVIMLAIEGFNTKRVLVDNGSSTDIMYMTAYQQIKLDPKRL